MNWWAVVAVVCITTKVETCQAQEVVQSGGVCVQSLISACTTEYLQITCAELK